MVIGGDSLLETASRLPPEVAPPYTDVLRGEAPLCPARGGGVRSTGPRLGNGVPPRSLAGAAPVSVVLSVTREGLSLDEAPREVPPRRLVPSVPPLPLRAGTRDRGALLGLARVAAAPRTPPLTRGPPSEPSTAAS